MADESTQFSLVNLLDWFVYRIHTKFTGYTNHNALIIFTANPNNWHHWLWNLKVSINEPYNGNPEFLRARDEILRVIDGQFDWDGSIPRYPALESIWSFFLLKYFTSHTTREFILLSKPTSSIPQIWDSIINNEITKIASSRKPNLFRAHFIE